MNLQVVASGERFPTDFASMGVIPSVGFDVSPLRHCRIKHLRTGGTGKHLRAKVDAISM